MQATTVKGSVIRPDILPPPGLLFLDDRQTPGARPVRDRSTEVQYPTKTTYQKSRQRARPGSNQ